MANLHTRGVLGGCSRYAIEDLANRGRWWPDARWVAVLVQTRCGSLPAVLDGGLVLENSSTADKQDYMQRGGGEREDGSVYSMVVL